MADDTVFRREALAHIGAGCLVVAAIAGLMAAFLSPVVLGALSRGNREAALSAGGVLAFSVAFALAIWLFFYLPSSLVAGAVHEESLRSVVAVRSSLHDRSGRSFAGRASSDQSAGPYPARILASIQYSIILGVGCALYRFS